MDGLTPRSAQTPLQTPSTWTRISAHHHFFPSNWEPNTEIYEDNARGIRLAWDSRSHRKGIPAVPLDDAQDDGEKGAASLVTKWRIKRNAIRWVGFDWWDITWWVAILFTVGSVFWCVNGILFFVFFDRTSLVYTNTESAFAFLGGTFFIVGAYLGWVESLNPARDADFGWEIDLATRTLIEPPMSHVHYALGRHRHHFGRDNSPLKSSPSSSPPPPSPLAPSTSASTAASTAASTETLRPQGWRWYGTYPSLGYVANTVQLFGASIFWISTLCGLPGILPVSGSTGGPAQEGTSEGLWTSLYWVFQVVGAPCFVFAGWCFCVEVQEKWWKPNIINLGWQIGFWNIIGGFGFLFCGIFGIWRQTAIGDPDIYQRWGTAFSTFWGSWAFLLGSYLQLWEDINKRT